jgi:hypothetical protein
MKRPVCLHVSAGLPLEGLPLYFILETFEKTVEKLHMRVKSDKNSGQFTRRREYVPLPPATWVYHESIFVQTSIFLIVDRDV